MFSYSSCYFLLMGTFLRILCITEVLDKTLRFANWVDVYVQNQFVFFVSDYDFFVNTILILRMAATKYNVVTIQEKSTEPGSSLLFLAVFLCIP